MGALASWMGSTLHLCSQIGQALGENFYLALLLSTGNLEIDLRSFSCGPELSLEALKNSKRTTYAPAKLLSLLSSVESEGIGMSPRDSTGVINMPFKGGVVQYEARGGISGVAISGFPEDLDHLLALILMYGIIQYNERVPFGNFPLKLHHVGRSYADYEEMHAALDRAVKEVGARALSLPAKDHERYYVPCTNGAGRVDYYQEFQFFPSNPHNGTHIDFVLADKRESLLSFLKSHALCEMRSRIYDDEPHYEVGIGLPLGVPFSVMFREKFTIYQE